MKILVTKGTKEEPKEIAFFCPNCKSLHVIPCVLHKAGKEDPWEFNRNYDKPVISPSVRIFTTEKGVEKTICHCQVTHGMIYFYDDYENPLKGQTVELPEVQE